MIDSENWGHSVETIFIFKYINTKENPADLPTRGLSSEDLMDCKLWWHGPAWLLKDQTAWPDWNVPVVDLDELKLSSHRTDILHEFSGIIHEGLHKISHPF